MKFFRVHFPICGTSIVGERKTIEAKLKSLNEADTGNTCEKCHKEFKYTIQKKRHKCEVKNDEINNTIVSDAKDDKFNIPSPSDQQKIFTCKIPKCGMKETKLEDIKRHYLLQHYKESLFAYLSKLDISYPAKCLRAKSGKCDKELANQDEYW